jgi:hypothetical protein
MIALAWEAPIEYRGPMQTRIQTVILTAIGLILQGCAAPKPAPPRPHATIYSTDMVNKAAVCSFTPLTALKDGSDNNVTLTTGGGGWCGFGVELDGHPYTAGLLTKGPKFGKVHIHTVGDDTRIDYTPQSLPVAADSFTVRLIPGNATIQVSVNTSPTVSK